MRRKLAVCLLTICLGMSMLMPQAVFGEETQKDMPKQSPYSQHSMVTMQKQGALKFPEEMEGVSKTVQEGTQGGLLLQGTAEEFSKGRIELDREFLFDGNPVGRVSVDGLADRGDQVSVEVFLDDQEEPIAEIPLKRQMGKTGWKRAGDRTADVLSQNITGSHRVSFRVKVTEASGTKPKQHKVLLRWMELAQSSIPVMYFNIDESQGTIEAMNGDRNHDTECYGKVTLQTPKGYQSEYGGEAATEVTNQTYDLEYLRGRGNSTWMGDKKPYKVKLDKKADLFGMGTNKHWILLANRYDNSLLRNKITYWLGQEMGMPFTPKLVPCEVVMNGEYYGSYFLTQQIRVGEDRVNIDDLEKNKASKESTDPEVITGGYLLNMESSTDDDYNTGYAGIRTSRDNTFTIERPSFEDYTNDAQRDYIRNYMQQTEDAIYGSGFKNKEGVSYEELLDVDAAVDYLWMQEFSSNRDAFQSGSTYLYKPRNDKLYWGPLWDFDYVAWGDLEYDGYNVSGYQFQDYPWFDRLIKDKNFAKKMQNRWPALRENVKKLIAPDGILDQYAKELQISWLYDHEKWGTYGGAIFFDRNDEDATITRSYYAEIEQLRTWISKRLSWVDSHQEQLIPVFYKLTLKNGKKVVKAKTIEKGHNIGKLPVLSKKNYTFSGWYAKKTVKVKKNKKWVNQTKWTRYKSSSKISKNTTLYARFAKKKVVKKPTKGHTKHIYFLAKDFYVSPWEDVVRVPVTLKPSNGKERTITWKSSKPSVAKVNKKGVVDLSPFSEAGFSSATVTITAKLSNGVKSSYRLHISEDYEELRKGASVKMNKTKVTVKRKSYCKLTPIFKKGFGTHDNYKWIVLDTKVASVDKCGVVTGKKKGTTTVIFMDCTNACYAKCKVTVR